MKCKGQISGSCHSTYPLCLLAVECRAVWHTQTPALSLARDSLPTPLPVGESTSSTPARQRAGKYRGAQSTPSVSAQGRRDAFSR